MKLQIVIDSYGFMFDAGDFLYFSLSWDTIIPAVLILVGYKVYKYKKGKK